MINVKMFCWFIMVSVLLSVHFADSSPLTRILEREKRMSDQRLAELETLIALSKMKHKLVTVPVGFGRVDPHKLGRRRRSVARLLRTLANDVSSTEEETREAEESRVDDDEKLLINLLYNEEFGERLRTND